MLTPIQSKFLFEMVEDCPKYLAQSLIEAITHLFSGDSNEIRMAENFLIDLQTKLLERWKE